MEWLEISGKTLEEAKELAIDKLGVDEGDVEFDVVEEPKQGLFGRTRGLARVRARVEPKGPRPKNDRRDKRKKSPAKSADKAQGDAPKKQAERKPRKKPDSGAAKSAAKSADKPAERSGPKPQKESAPIEDVRAQVDTFLTGLTAAFGFEGDVTIPEEDDTINAVVSGKHGLMIGPRGRTLDAIQELTRVSAQRSAPSGVRIRVDVGGYRDARKAALADFASEAAAKAREDQVEVVLEPMSSADRKTLHDALNELDGVTTRSAGNEPRRRVIVVPAEVEGADAE